MESNLINDNDNIKFENKKENNIKSEINENLDINIYNKEKINRENGFEISKDISYKNNTNYKEIDVKDNKILNPVTQKSRDKKKGQQINIMQKLLETKRNFQKNEDSTREKSNFKEDESSEISEKENTNKNESIDNEIPIKNNINNNNLLTEKLKIIFQKRNKTENKNKFDDLKYSSDSNSELNDNNLNNEEIKIEKQNDIISDSDDDNNYNKNNKVKRKIDLNKNEDELISISSSEDENEIKKMEEEEKKKKEIEIRAQKLIQMMLKQKSKEEKEEEEEEKEKEDKDNFNNENNDNINEDNDMNNSNLKATPSKIINREKDEYDDSEKDNSIKNKKFNQNLDNESNSKNKFSNEDDSDKSNSINNEDEEINKENNSKKNAQINGLRNILEMLKEKQLEKERDEEKIRIEEARIRKEEREKRIREREEKRRKKKEEEEKELLRKKKEEEELQRKKEEEEELKRKKEEELKKREKEALEELENIRKEKERKKKEEEEELKEQEEIKLRENKRLEEEMKRKENQRKKFAEIQSQYEKIKEQEAKLKTEGKNRTQKVSSSKINSSNNNNNSNKSFFYNNNNKNNNDNNSNNIIYPFTPNNKDKNNIKSLNEIENEYKKEMSFSEYQTQEKELMIFEEMPKIQDRSFDSGTYQKPIQSYFTNQDFGTRSTKALIYSRKGIKNNFNKKNSNRNNIKNIRNNDKITNFNSPILNNTFQEHFYKKNQNIYSRSPQRYSKPIKNNINNRYIMNEFEKLNNSSFNKNINSISYSNNKNSNMYSSNNQSSLSINLEDLMILEEKLSDIINAVIANKNLSNECFEWWNYYYNCSLFGQIEKVFKGNDTNIIKSSINYELLSIMICYDISFDKSLLKKVFIMIKAILNLNHKNLIIICEYILSKISNDSLLNSWVYKLRDLVKSATSISDESEYVSFNIEPLSIIEKIKYNTNCISNDIKMILKNYPYTQLAENLVLLYKNIIDSSYEDINQFFRDKILRIENPNASVLASIVLKENSNFYTVVPPYLKTKNLKNYTLVLDLNETLINFKIDSSNESEGVLRVRPGIYEFLEKVGKYYEIIVFTVSTQDYADLIIDAIEESKIYFDYRLYRQHTVILNNDFVKDLSRLGRPIDKIIIVDNMIQNFRLQKENGINIRTFWGEDPYDTALFDLMDILIKIAKEGGDVRIGLRKYRDEIVRKVTSNISKH